MIEPAPDIRPRQATLLENRPALTHGTLLAGVTCLEKFAEAHQAPFIRPGLSLLRNKVKENRFYLTVVGQFKRGKSSFLNALLGANVLPVAILPLTSIVTVLRYGESPEAQIVLHSGKSTRIGLEELTDYITEKANPRNSKGVGQAEVFYPSEYLRRGVVLVDTPGIGSVYTNNTQTTYDFLPRIDAAIFVTSPDPTITKVEIDFLCDLASRVDKVFVIVNKADLLPPDQILEVLDFTRHSLPPFICASVDSILAVSATQALTAKQNDDKALLATSGFALLEERLGAFLLTEKNQVFYASVVRNMRNLIADVRLTFEIRIQAARMPLEELRTKIDELNDQLAAAERQRDDNRVLIWDSVARLSKFVEGEAMRFAETMAEPLRSEICQHFETIPPFGRQKLADELDKFLKARIASLLDGWKNGFECEVMVQFQQATKRFTDSINNLIDNVRQTAGLLFGLSVKRLEIIEALAEIRPCRYITDTALSWGLGNAPRLLPPGLFRPYLLRVMLRKAEPELQRNATLLALDYKDRFNKSVTILLAEINSKLDETVEGIRNAMASASSRHQAGSSAAQIQVTEWEASLAGLAACEDLLNRGSGGTRLSEQSESCQSASHEP